MKTADLENELCNSLRVLFPANIRHRRPTDFKAERLWHKYQRADFVRRQLLCLRWYLYSFAMPPRPSRKPVKAPPDPAPETSPSVSRELSAPPPSMPAPPSELLDIPPHMWSWIAANPQAAAWFAGNQLAPVTTVSPSSLAGALTPVAPVVPPVSPTPAPDKATIEVVSVAVEAREASHAPTEGDGGNVVGSSNVTGSSLLLASPAHLTTLQYTTSAAR